MKKVESVGVTFNAGERFPLKLPAELMAGGYAFELLPSGSAVVIDSPGLKVTGLKTFEKGPRLYTSVETKTRVPIADLIFDLGPHFTLDVNFDARVCPAHDSKATLLNNYLNANSGPTTNLKLSLLDRYILQAVRTIQVSPLAVSLFHDTIRKQLGLEYKRREFVETLSSVSCRGP